METPAAFAAAALVQGAFEDIQIRRLRDENLACIFAARNEGHDRSGRIVSVSELARENLASLFTTEDLLEARD